MLSRLSLRAVKDVTPSLAVVSKSTSTVSVTSDNAERDLINFPKMERAVDPGKVRLGFVPEEFFQFMYPKTGVTGPYVFGVSLLTFLYSKEILVMDHEFYVGCTELFMAMIAFHKFGPSLAAYGDKLVEEESEAMDKPVNENIAIYTQAVDDEKAARVMTEGQSMLFAAKKENVGLQLEAAYRERLAQVHSTVKKRLDYQLEMDNVKTRLEQRHIVRWVVDAVTKSLTPTQEAAALKQCLNDLKLLAKA